MYTWAPPLRRHVTCQESVCACLINGKYTIQRQRHLCCVQLHQSCVVAAATGQAAICLHLHLLPACRRREVFSRSLAMHASNARRHQCYGIAVAKIRSFALASRTAPLPSPPHTCTKCVEYHAGQQVTTCEHQLPGPGRSTNSPQGAKTT